MRLKYPHLFTDTNFETNTDWIRRTEFLLGWATVTILISAHFPTFAFYYSSREITIHRLLFIVLLIIIFYASFMVRDEIQKFYYSRNTIHSREKFVIHYSRKLGLRWSNSCNPRGLATNSGETFGNAFYWLGLVHNSSVASFACVHAWVALLLYTYIYFINKRYRAHKLFWIIDPTIPIITLTYLYTH